MEPVLKLLSKKDKKAYEALFALYYDKLLHIAKGYLETMEDAEGLVQNVFLKLWEKKESFDNIDNINNYLYTMTKNACLDFLKHKKVKLSYSKSYYDHKTSIQYQFLEDEAASYIIRSELQERISEAIKLLPEKCQKVFIKSRFEGMKHTEIAEVFQISKRTVDNHISNALQHMRLHLKEFLT